MAIENHLLTENGTSGVYWLGLPTNDPGDGTNYKMRYYDGTSYRVYSSMYYWYDALPATASYAITVSLEIQGKWDDTYDVYSAGYTLKGYRSIRISTLVNGQRDPDSFHGGILGGGYRRIDGYSYGIRGDGLYTKVDGIELIGTTASDTILPVGRFTVLNSIIENNGGAACFGASGSGGNLLANNLIHGGTYGVHLNGYKSGDIVANNLIINCGIGIDATNNYLAFIGNNIAIGNTTNWGAAPTAGVFDNNAGEAGDIIWTSVGATSLIVSPADFANYLAAPAALADYRPAGDSIAHTTTSLLVDSGSEFTEGLPQTDMVGNPRPAYKNGLATEWDVGPFEFDWGYGLAPASVQVSISGIVEGSELAIYKTSDGSTVVSPVAIGPSGVYNFTYSYTGDVLITVVVRKSTSGVKYLPYAAKGVIADTGFAITVSQVEDTIVL